MACVVIISFRHLYYTDWGDEAGVYRTHLDGSDPVTIRTGLDNPNSVMLHHTHLYMVDSHYKTRTQINYPRPKRQGGLYRAGTDGTDWRELEYASVRNSKVMKNTVQFITCAF